MGVKAAKEALVMGKVRFSYAAATSVWADSRTEIRRR